MLPAAEDAATARSWFRRTQACAPPKVPVSPSGSPAPPAAPTAEPRGTDVTAIAVSVTVAALVIAAAGLIARALLKRRELRIATDSVVTVDATAPTEGTRLNRKLRCRASPPLPPPIRSD